MAASSPLRIAGSPEPSEAIDDDHLARMTLGDRALEREVLEIFLRQATIMIERIERAEPGLAAAAAHTLTGSARGVGAWRVAQAAERLEQAAGNADAALDEAVDALKAATVEAGAAINARLGKALREH
jgi:HPt (histidine-containing phosphotransfer) domain-containing protein